MKSACEFPDWNNNVHYLDTAEMAAAISIGYDWFYNLLSDADKNYFEDKLYSYALIHSLKIYEDRGTGISQFWPYNENNWCGVCNGGTVMAACAVFERYPDMCSDIISYSLKSVANMARKSYPDGGWDEGSGYAVYCMKYISFMCNTLKNTMGTDFNIPLGFYGICDFLMSIDGPGGAFNYHDSYPEHTMCEINGALSEMFNRTDLITVRKKALSDYNLELSPLDLIYYKSTDECNDINIANDMFFRGNDVVFMRKDYKDIKSVYAGMQAGYPICGHSHLDGGTFTIDMLGERWIHNLPQDSYGLDGYFGTTDERYQYYRTRTESENCYVINPSDGGYGQNMENTVYITNFESGINTSYAVADLTPAYEKDVISAKRGLMLADNKSSVVLRDEIKFKNKDNEIYWFANISRNASVDIKDNNVTITNPSGKKIVLKIDVSGFENYSISVMDAKPLDTSPNPPGQNQNIGLRKLAIHAYNGSDTYINVKFCDPDAAYSKIEYDGSKSIASWINHENTIPINVKYEKDIKSGIFNAEISFNNTFASASKKITVFCVSYSNSRIQSLSQKNISLSKLGNIKIKNGVNIKSDTEFVKIIITDENLKPLTECIVNRIG